MLKPGEYLVARAELAGDRPCTSCGAPMVWILTANNRRMPLSVKTARRVTCQECEVARANRLEPHLRGAGESPANLPPVLCTRCGSTGELFVVLSHFADCPNSRTHSARAKVRARRARRQREDIPPPH